ncbi:hypothetical protein DSLASN_06390 [Desulfoluna limicola]|uniref:Uncharacterized protein n=1 Tax=Desulfoluna limicola TaxID=2810562 RepID=A0ABM7PCZ4_9BACT|nr:hypothetical protein DSLASN_06390 [Desulfoluna limicola]
MVLTMPPWGQTGIDGCGPNNKRGLHPTYAIDQIPTKKQINTSPPPVSMGGPDKNSEKDVRMPMSQEEGTGVWT